MLTNLNVDEQSHGNLIKTANVLIHWHHRNDDDQQRRMMLISAILNIQPKINKIIMMLKCIINFL